ncbi:MAG TPA: LptF/LptG family permease [Pyrinomonadaceae bacterium]|nr:LptF/LptG family permease [Pyrinomonadaceae bacterium]
MASRRLIERYIIRAIVPYAVAAFVLLTGILFVQQSGRYFETIFQAIVPAGFLYQLALAILPTVLIFTIPMSILSGTIIGFGRMSSDSELVAMRAAGVSRWRMLLPALLIGVVSTAVSLQLNLNEAPRAQQQLRAVALRGALYKLDSPVEPQTFTTDIPGYAIYVREGDKSRGQWGGVFIHAVDEKGNTQLVTARSGRIDSSEEKSELVLNDAVRTHLPPATTPNQQYVVERLEQLRFLIKTGRSELLAALQKREVKADEMVFSELRQFISQSDGPARRDASLILHKRLSLAIAPLVFSFCGAVLSLRMRRGSRGFGALVSLLVMSFYYLLIIAGEQMTRGGTIPPIVGGWMATAIILLIAISMFVADRVTTRGWLKRSAPGAMPASEKPKRAGRQRRLSIFSFPSLLDAGVVRTMSFSFLFGFIALLILFDVFTSFELWRFLNTKGGTLKMLAEYLYYLTPLVSVELFPAATLVASLLTYALIARRREAIAWWASGQSVYRLMLPGLIFAIAVATASWFIQEKVMPQANVKQDNLRLRIRGNPAQSAGVERRWLLSSDGMRIYSYDFDERRQALRNPAIYEFDSARIGLKRVITGDDGQWVGPNKLEIKTAQWFELDQPQVARQSAQQMTIDGVEPPAVFKPTVDRPSQLDSVRLRRYIHTLKARGADTATLALGLQKKYASPFSVIMMALIGMPLAISLGRKSTVIALCSAVVVSLFFWLLSSGFHQLGEHALLPPEVAAWAPIAIFSGSAFYFISRVRT